MSRRPDFLPIDNLYKLDESLSWDVKVLDIDTHSNGLALLALSTLEALNVDGYFLSNLKGAYSTCVSFSNGNVEKRLRQKMRNHPTGYLDITIEQ